MDKYICIFTSAIIFFVISIIGFVLIFSIQYPNEKKVLNNNNNLWHQTTYMIINYTLYNASCCNYECSYKNTLISDNIIDCDIALNIMKLSLSLNSLSNSCTKNNHLCN